MDSFFKITERGSTVGREVRGGLVTFFTMAYIVVLNPIILLGAVDGDGQALGARLRERDASLKIIFASGHGDARSFVQSNRTAFLQKPFAIEDLVDTMVGLGCGVRS